MQTMTMDEIWQHQVEMGNQGAQSRLRKHLRVAEEMARVRANLDAARALKPAPIKADEPKRVLISASGIEFYEVEKEGSKVRLPYVSILR